MRASLVGLVTPEAGEILFHGVDLRRLSRFAWKPYRGRIQMVFQDPFASLNPRRKVGEIVAAGPIAQGVLRAAALARARDLLRLVQMEDAATGQYPHEFSAGQRQRIGIARALATEPELLIVEDPVLALDLPEQAQLLALLTDFRQRRGLTMLFVTRDLRLAGQLCNRVAVMQDGAIVEQGAVGEVFRTLRHPYTQLLLDSIPGRGWTPPQPA